MIAQKESRSNETPTYVGLERGRLCSRAGDRTLVDLYACVAART